MDVTVMLAGIALMLMGFIILAVYLLLRVGYGQVRGEGFSVILVGPIPIIVRGGLWAVLLPVLLAAILLILALLLWL
jgi:uncharacterized membrane protein